jgi:phosphoglycolate phosphatase-like HAD superfamily hydrolase
LDCLWNFFCYNWLDQTRRLRRWLRLTNVYYHCLVPTRYAEVPFGGAADLLAALAEHNDVRLGIATGHVSHAIAPALERFGWQSHFCTVQTVDKAPSKPHPGMVLQALEKPM